LILVRHVTSRYVTSRHTTLFVQNTLQNVIRHFTALCDCICVCVYVCMRVYYYYYYYYYYYFAIQHAPLQSNTACFRAKYSQYNYIYIYIYLHLRTISSICYSYYFLIQYLLLFCLLSTDLLTNELIS